MIPIKLKDRNGETLNIGDRVQILKVSDDSGNATDLFGMEIQLNSWVDLIYLETFEGIITYNEDKMLVEIKGDRTSIPLSSHIRYNIWNNLYDMIEGEDLKNIMEEFHLPNMEYEAIINYIMKI